MDNFKKIHQIAKLKPRQSFPLYGIHVNVHGKGAFVRTFIARNIFDMKILLSTVHVQLHILPHVEVLAAYLVILCDLMCR